MNIQYLIASLHQLLHAGKLRKEEKDRKQDPNHGHNLIDILNYYFLATGQFQLYALFFLFL